jgi:endonuclease I
MKQFGRVVGIFILMTLGNHLFAQGTYYNGISESLRCAPLKTALSKLIGTGTAYVDYVTVGGRFLLTSGDVKKSDDGLRNIMWDIYSDNPSGPEPYEFPQGTLACGTASTEGSCWNREHLVAASWFGGANKYPMYSDLYILVPADGFVNGKRGNNPHGEVGSASFTSLNGSKLGTSSVSGLTGTVFEPIDEYKGDVARAYFYFVTRYEDSLKNYTSAEAKRVFTNNTFPALQPGILKMLLKWHQQDPPSDKERKEITVNQVAQNNRNPFIDRPEYATRIWGTDGTDCATATSIKERQAAELKIFPNPSSDGSLRIVSVDLPGQVSYNIVDFSGRTVSSGFAQQQSNKAAELSIPSILSGIYFLVLTDSDGNLFTGSLVKM